MRINKKFPRVRPNVVLFLLLTRPIFINYSEYVILPAQRAQTILIKNKSTLHGILRPAALAAGPAQELARSAHPIQACVQAVGRVHPRGPDASRQMLRFFLEQINAATASLN
jgi:hypothetical protein